MNLEGLEAVRRDINDIKIEQVSIKKDVRKLQDTTLLHDKDITDMKIALQDIKEDTRWTRRALTNAIIGSIIGGAVAIFYAAIKTI